jgi:hypothetical protein
MRHKAIVFLTAIIFSVPLNAQDSIKFVLAQTIPDTAGNDIVLADFDNEGNIDAFIANGKFNRPMPSKLWINDGTGHYTDSKQNFGGAKSWSAAYGDVNGDGSFDLFIANGDWKNGDSSRLWINNGHGQFTCSANTFGKTNSSCAAMGDLNGDGAPDIFLANHPYSNGKGGEDEVWANDGKANFTKSGQTLGGTDAARRVKLAEVNGDGFLDAVVLNGDTNRIWLNDGNGHFKESQHSIGVGENIDLAICDIDHDGDNDIVLVKGAWGKKPKGIEVWTNDGKGNFSRSQSIGSYDGYGIAAGDLNKDQDIDLVVVNGPNQPNQIFLNNHGHFYDSNIDIGSGGNKAAVCDVNHDNLLDIIIAGDENTKVYLQVKDR